MTSSRPSGSRTDGWRSPSRRRATRPRLEFLEGRTLLSVWTVTDNTDNPNDTASLRYAIDNEPDGTIIRFAPNVTNIILGSPLNINTNLDIEGPGPNALTVTGDNSQGDPVFELPANFDTTVTLAGLTIANGNLAGIDNLGGGTLTMRNCTVVGCRGPKAGPGGIYSLGALTMINCTVADNSGGYGGGIACFDLTMTECSVTGNSASYRGGGIYPVGTSTLTSCTVTGNTATDGGGIYANSMSGNLTTTNCTVTGNSAGADGGGIGGAHTLTLTNSTVNNNSVGGNGGGIDTKGKLTMTNCTLANNAASGDGAGIENESGATATMTNCTLASNSAPSGSGGGLLNFGMLTATNCTLTGNSSVTNGGGGDNQIGGTLTMTNCTLAGNSSGFGGGLLNVGMLTTTNCTFAGNFAGGGGGITNLGTLNLGNTIVAGNNAGFFGSPDVDGTVTSNGYNLIGNTSGARGFVASDLLNQNPLLGTLEANGGPTQTMALLPGSPAIDAGRNALIPSGVTTDQRGFARIVNGTVDIGAFESRGFTIAITSGNAQSTTVKTGFLNPLVVTATSPYGDPVAGGVVTFTGPGSGAGATFSGGPASSATATIDPTGQTAVSVAANTVAGSYAVEATARGASFAAGLSLTNTPGAAAAITTATAGTPQSTTVGYAFAIPLQVLVTDAYGNPVPGVSVTFAAPTTGASGSLSAGAVVTTNALGIAAPTFTANTKAGVYSVAASASGVGTPATFSLTNTPDVASTLLISAPATVTSGVQFSFTVTALDHYGNTATGYRGTVQFASSDLKATLPADYMFVAADSGVHTFPATFSTQGPETLTVSDTVTLSLTSTVTLTLTPKGSAVSASASPSTSSLATGEKTGVVQIKPRHRVDLGAVGDRQHGVVPHVHVHDRAPHLFLREMSTRRKG
jgi:hypothetical protein